MKKKLFRKVHLWLAVPFGVVLTLVCLSGAALAFEDEVVRLTHRSHFYVRSVGQPAVSLDEAARRVEATLPEGVTVTGVTVHADPARTWQVNVSSPRRAWVAFDPYSAEVIGLYERPAFFATAFRLHRWLLATPSGGGSWGKTLVGVSVLAFVVILVSGIVIWWPRTRRALKRALSVSTSKGLRRFWYDLHTAGGMYVVVFLLLAALTGLTWSFPWFRNAVYFLCGVEVPQGGGHGGDGAREARGGGGDGPTDGSTQASEPWDGSTDGSTQASEPWDGSADGSTQASEPWDGPADGSTQASGSWDGSTDGSTQASGSWDGGQWHPADAEPWQAAYEALVDSCPGAERISVSASSATVAYARLGNQRASDRYDFDPATGRITGSTAYADTPASGKIRGWIYSLHVGSWGGMVTRVLAFLAALVGASLPLTGYYLWIRRLRPKRRKA